MTMQEFWAAWSAIATTVLTAVALTAAAIALRQLAEMARARQADILIWIFNELDRLRHSRRIICNQMSNWNAATFADMPDELRVAADNVAASLDYLGLMIRERLVRKDPAIHLCLAPIVLSWEALADYVRYRRAMRGHYWEHFEYLYTEAKEFQRRRGIKVTPFRDKEGEAHPADPKGRDHA